MSHRATLTPKQRRFVLAYQQHGNATRAALEAGYDQRWPGAAGGRVLKHPAVRAALEAHPVASRLLVRLGSGVEVGFSYGGRPITAAEALAKGLSEEASPAERGAWVGGLALCCGLKGPQ